MAFHVFPKWIKPSASIEKISIDEAENSLKMLCSFADSAIVTKFQNDKTILRLDIQNGNYVSDDVIITDEEILSPNSILLTIQPPLEASIFKTRKRDFILQLKAENKIIKASKTVVLGSAFKTFDLLPYAHTDIFQLLTNIAILFFIFSVILFLINPLHQKFKFKRDYVMKYLEMNKEDKSRTDPFTFVAISENDEVVNIDEEVMLLSSWKRLKKLPDSRPAREHSNFFDHMSSRSFFNPFAGEFSRTDRAWFGLFGILVGWLLFSLFMYLDLGENILSTRLFDTENLQVSSVIARDFLMGITLGLCYAVILALINRFRPERNFKIIQIVKITAIRTTYIAFAFLVQSLITVYLFQNPYINGFVAWCLVGIAFVFPLDGKTDIVKKLGIGSGIGIISYCVFQLTTMSYLHDVWGTDLPLFFGLALMGCLASAMPYSKITKKHLAKLKALKRPELSSFKIKKSIIGKNNSAEKKKPKDKSVLQKP